MPLILKRIFAGIVIALAVVGLILSLGGLVGVWISRSVLTDGVTAVHDRASMALNRVDQGLTNLGTQVDEARQSLDKVEQAVTQAGDRIASNSPVLDTISGTVGVDLLPKLESMR